MASLKRLLSVEGTDESIPEFNPNDIVIEDVEEVEANGDGADALNHETLHEVAMAEEIQPVTGETESLGNDHVAMVDVDPYIDQSDVSPVENGGSDGWDDPELIGEQDSLLADNNTQDDSDVLDDILNA